jgi:hypothetical protein
MSVVVIRPIGADERAAGSCCGAASHVLQEFADAGRTDIT